MVLTTRSSPEPGGGENGAQILHDPVCLDGDIAVDQAHRFRIERDLTRRENEPARHHSLRIGTDGGRRPLGGHDLAFNPFPCHSRSLPVSKRHLPRPRSRESIVGI